jgi:hypothetical protein
MANLAGAIHKGYETWERKAHDLYPTPEDVTQALIDALRLPKTASILDPCCGDGKLLRVFTANGYHKTRGCDIRYTGYGWQGRDYLAKNFETMGSDAIVMNPPFSLATEFIEKALTEAPIVAVLLKADFWNTQDRHQLGRTQPPTHMYPLTWRPAFLKKERGNNPLMNCSWFVWRKDAKALYWRQLTRPRDVPLLGYRGISPALADLGAALDDLTSVIC